MAHDVEPGSRRDVSRRRSGGIRPLHTLALIAVGVAGVLVAFWVLSFIAGVIWLLVKVVVVVAVLGGLAWILLGRRRA